MLIVCFLLLLAYLSGSVSGSLTLGRLRGVDIRTQGSGNAGGSNAFRTQGAKFALGVVLIDIGKGALAAWLALRFAPVEGVLPVRMVAWLAVLAAALGHVWPLWHGFRGGKGAATAAGGVLMLWPWLLPPIVLAWLLVLLATGYVGLSTVVAALTVPLWAWWTDASPDRWAFAIAMSMLLLFTHRANLMRLWRGEESRFERARLLHRLYRRGRG